MESGIKKARKRPLMDIAASLIIREGEEARCNIVPNGDCTYVQKKYEAGNFIRHFRLRHSELANEYGLLKDYIPAAKKPRVVTKRAIAIDAQLLIEAVVKLVTDHRLPLSCFEWDGFRLLLEPICKAVGCTLNRENIKNHLRIMAFRIKDILKQQMKNQLISLKVDSASRYNRHILGVNVQYAFEEKVVIRSLGKSPLYFILYLCLIQKHTLYLDYETQKLLIYFTDYKLLLYLTIYMYISRVRSLVQEWSK